MHTHSDPPPFPPEKNYTKNYNCTQLHKYNILPIDQSWFFFHLYSTLANLPVLTKLFGRKFCKELKLCTPSDLGSVLFIYWRSICVYTYMYICIVKTHLKTGPRNKIQWSWIFFKKYFSFNQQFKVNHGQHCSCQVLSAMSSWAALSVC